MTWKLFSRHLPALLSLSPAEYVSCLAVKCLNKFTKYSVPNIFVCKMIRHQTKKDIAIMFMFAVQPL